MRSFDPNDKHDVDTAARLCVEPWMLELVALNPSYPYWGPHEDYMYIRGEDEGPDGFGREPTGGWNSRIIGKAWPDTIELDELNEVVNFYFDVERPSVECDVCGGDGYHPDAHWVSDSFYSHSSPFKPQSTSEWEASMVLASFGSNPPKPHVQQFPSRETLDRYGKEFTDFCNDMRTQHEWNANITEDEALALVLNGRGGRCTTAADFNGEQGGKGFGHDCINRGILIKERCKRFGIPTTCSQCEGHGHVFTGPPFVNLILWVIHPRKGASRGVEIKFTKDDVPAVLAYLKEAAQRNADRFAKVVAAVTG